MNMTTKQDIFQEFLKEYISASRERKGEILDHIIKTTKMKWRESAVRRFKRMQMRDNAYEENRGRKVYYTKDVDTALDYLLDMVEVIEAGH